MIVDNPIMTLSELEELYEKDKLIIYLKAILNDDSYPDHHRAVLEYLIELNQ
jgi:hypothetical protein